LDAGLAVSARFQRRSVIRDVGPRELMPLMPKPTNIPAEVIRSRFEEMKQLRNQQFLLGTVAITFFGVYAGLFMPKAANANAPVEVYRWSTVAVLFVLCILFMWARLLRHLIDVISMWLAETDSSVWDQQYRL
jgi:hypothetical protein